MGAGHEWAGAAPHDEELVDLLGQVPVFAGCGADGLRRIARLGTLVRRRQGTVLQRAGHTLRQAMVVVDGTVCDRGPTGRERTLTPGHLVGAAALADMAAQATSEVVALTDVQVLVFGRVELHDVAQVLAAADAVAAPAPARERRRAGLRRPRPAIVDRFPAGLPAPA